MTQVSSGSDGGSGSRELMMTRMMNKEEKKDTIIDATETNLISLRRTIYLTIQSTGLRGIRAQTEQVEHQARPGEGALSHDH